MNGNVEFSIDLSSFKEIEDKIEQLKLTDQDKDRLLNSIGGLIIQQANIRFENKTDPDNKPWVNWSQKYKLTRHDGQSILENTGHLTNSFEVDIKQQTVDVKSVEPYSASNNYGDNRVTTKKTKKGRSKSFARNIPKRTFLGINDDDKKEITNTVIKYIDKKFNSIIGNK